MLAAFIAGFLLDDSARAQDTNLPFAVGERIQIGPSNLCTVQAVRGTFIQCDALTGEEWWNLTTIERIRKSPAFKK